MVPGMGGLRDDLNKLPAVRPSPVGQENVNNQNPAPCSTINYSQNDYRNRTYPPTDSYQSQQQMPYYPASDQQSVHSGNSLSSSSTSLNSDFNQAANFEMVKNQGYVNPIYQTKPQPGYAQPYKNNFPTANSYQQPTAMPPLAVNHYATYGQQTQSVASVQLSTTQEPISSTSTQQQSMNYNTTANNNSYMNPSNQFQQPQAAFDASQQFYQNQFQAQQQFSQQNTSQQQYPVAQSPGGQQQYPATHNPIAMQQQPSQQQQQFPAAQPPIASQYSGIQQHVNQPSSAQSPGPMQNQTPLQNVSSQTLQKGMEQQYSNAFDQNSMQNQLLQQGVQSHVAGHQDKGNQPNFYSYNSNNPAFMMNQYGEKFSQQNYSCYTPTINSNNSYMTSGDTQLPQSQTTQSVNYNIAQEIITSQYGLMPQAEAASSPLHQPHSIPTYSAAMNATATNSSEMHMTQSQNQITSHSEAKAPIAAPPKTLEVKSSNIDLLSGIDFSMTNPSVENIPTLMPVSVSEKKDSQSETPAKVLQPTTSKPSTPAKLNDDLADLDFNSLSPNKQPDMVKASASKKAKYHEDPFEDVSVLKQFHKEVESLEKFMESLTVKTMNGATPLAGKWKELQDLLVKDEAKRSVSIARLFPDKNRSVDCLPYDHARVLLPTATDNYINAVLVKDCGPVGFILTQTPMTNTVNDYWEMVWSQKSGILVCLHSVNEVS